MKENLFPVLGDKHCFVSNQVLGKGIIKTPLLFVLLLFMSFQSVFAQAVPQQTYQAMCWRLVGPFRAGWATMTAGIPNEPNTFYFGGAGGGVWKTTDAGLTWHPLMQHQSAAAVGAIAISVSNPKVIYVGTGQVTTRYDNMAGNGVFRSANGGKTWKNVGLIDTRHIGRILIDPKDPNRVLVAALGHVYDTNSERGVFLTNDGGKHWRKVLFVNDQTGAVDLAWDPKHPQIVYAAMWQMKIHPWLDYFQPKVGPGSGIFKSDDGGVHWKRLTGNGLPGVPMGRIGLAVARGSAGKVVYATILTTNGEGGLYRSDNAGETWKWVNHNSALSNDYFARVTVAPNNPMEVYVMGRSIRRSMDGGVHFKIIKGAPGGDDYHFLWINPASPSHMITGADQGAAVTVDGGKSWTGWYNQPTGQFYHIAVDDQFPFHIYSGQQDNGTVDIASQGPYGVIEERDWHPVGGDERDYMVPKPGDPNIVFGSGLGGHISRFNEVTRQVANVSPWPISSYGSYPPGVKYRYTWITPLVFSHLGQDPMYFGAQYLFKSVDNGDHWSIISPDLTGKTRTVKDIKNPTDREAKVDGFGVIYTIAPSPINKNVIWVGTDDGLIQVTYDGGAHWQNVTPRSIPDWGRIDAISPSAFNPKVAYAAIDLHRIGKFAPMILMTTNGGKTWKNISNGLPGNQYTTVVRADPKKQGLLYAGSDRGVFVSFNNGGNWQPLSMNLPTTWVRDLKVHDNDLVIATQGHGIWILDDVEPLREISSSLASEQVHLFHPAMAYRLRGDENKDTPPPPSTPLGKNPPAGAIIDYWLKNTANGPITITIRDQEGHLIRRYVSNEMNKKLPSSRYFQKGWLGSPQQLSTSEGMHRFVWNLRYTRPEALHYDFSIAGVWEEHTPLDPRGPFVLPGQYNITLTVDGRNYTKSVLVKMDPRVHVGREALVEQLKLAKTLDRRLNMAVSTYKKIEKVLKEQKNSLSNKDYEELSSIANGGKYNLSSVSGIFAMLVTKVEGADAAPNQGQKAVFNDYNNKLENLMGKWHRLESKLHIGSM